ncbi:MAG: hypothetical protein DMF95_10350 [Acidobacteria bacterium]|nr:MAG: hypothetical protein DMF96_02865 [Acidobacteriota bacterium]PYR23876.1 MAG: hypothetical protein DMF94_00030 [Acidobacteriota bacterium]PYR50568.1 MAG: hypothetical protein DMF95_10350 [Acidobacteriota bacterium]
MSDHDFFFALEMSDESELGRMLGELVTAVLGHVGYAAPAIEELTTTVRGVLADGAAGGRRRCDVRFQARDGELQIVVARAGSAEWRTTRPCPGP